MRDDGLVRRHDNYQFEIKLAYDLHPWPRREHYRVDTFFFIPESLDVNEATYGKDRFYRDLLLYIRFRTPDFGLSALTDAGNERSPLARAASKLESARAEPTAARTQTLDYEMRLLGCVLRNTLRAQTRQVARALDTVPRDIPQAQALLDEFLAQAPAAVRRFREMRPALEDPSLPDAVRATHRFVDEYMSLLLEERAHVLLRALQSAGDGLPEHARRLAQLVDAEIAHRRDLGLPSRVEESGDNEGFIFRVGVLKKFVSSALHLTVHTREEGRGVEHMALAVAAGLAMVFFTAIAFYYQQAFGALSLSFFSILVVSYMFKDRLKAMVQARLQAWLARNLFDQKTRVYDPFSRRQIGLCREAVAFVPESKIDPRVRALRNRDHITEIENTWRAERVLHYIKEITLYSRRFLRRHSRKGALTDIVRFNLRNFLLKMDEPASSLFFLKDGRSVTARGTRVYHVNIVLRFRSARETRYERIRLVLNRDGIKRIESVSSELAEGGEPSLSPLRGG